MTFINAEPSGQATAQFSGLPTAPVPDLPDLPALLARTPLLEGMPQEVLAELARDAQQRRHGNGETLFYEGDEAQHCLVVAKGAVEVLRYDASGDERMLHRFGEGQLVAEVAMFMPHGLYPMTARAQGDTVVWRIPRRSLRDACGHSPALALRLLESLSLRLYQRVNEVHWLTSSTAPQRLAAYLLAQAARQGDAIELPTSQRHLAAHLGVRAETLNRMLSEWQAKGWIRGQRRRWRLLCSDALRELAASAERAF